MYMDDTAMYMDILPYEDSKSQLVEPSKLPEQDPWLLSDTGVSDIELPVSNGASNTHLFGRLSPTMEEFANSLLPSDMTLPLLDDNTFDVDAALDSLIPKNDDGLGDTFGNLTLEPAMQYPVEPAMEYPVEPAMEYPVEPAMQYPQPAETGGARRRSKRRASKPTPTYSDQYDLEEIHPNQTQDLDYSVDQSPLSDYTAMEGNEEGASRTQRKRRPRVSYNTLTEDQKYQHIRNLNNEASRLYRERIKDQLTSLQERESFEMERNRILRAKAEGLEKLRDEIKAFTFNFFREHMGNSGAR